MAKMQEFKCPCCGGSIEFDSSVQKMKCPFCDTEFDVGTLSEYAQTVEEEQPEDMSWSDEAGSEWQDGESEGLRTYVCKSCGGEIVGDANTAATACPFCGSPVVMTGQLSGALKPDYVFPGYVLIKMVLTDETWHIIRNIRGVTGFVGEANKAIPLTDEEVRQMSLEKHEIVVKYNVGETVKITDGPLASFTGIVEEIEPEKNKVRVVVSMFGRETPVELELDQVEVLS